jgi:hypothetical protein
LLTALDSQSATLLSDGRVLIAGGGEITDATELYDPATGTFSPAGDMLSARDDFTATPLLDGRVLMAGGISSVSGDFTNLASAELYQP